MTPALRPPSNQVQADWDSLLEAVLSFARQHLQTHGGFVPFGATITAEGDVAPITPDDAVRDETSQQQALKSLYGVVRRIVDRSRAAAFASDVRANGANSIRVELEHSEGASVTVLMKYTRTPFTRAVRYGQFEVEPARPHVWAQD